MSTEVIVETVYDTIIVDESPPNTILVESPGTITVLTTAEQGPPGPAGPAGIENIGDALDVDSTNKTNGSILVYSTANQKWVATTLLENQSVESGHY
jgi:hypothetical protein